MLKLFLILLAFAAVVFRGLFLGSIYWGDSPHFGIKEITQFQSEPLAWSSLGNNFGGPNLTIWLSPLMFLWRYLSPQILFIFPSIVLSLIGPILLSRYLKFSKKVQFFSAAVYLFNTYFILLIDGGQLGVALGYGFFPFSILVLRKLLDKPIFKNFYLALIILFVHCLIDPRIALIAIMTSIIWNLNQIKKMRFLIPLGASLLIINLFWLVPFLANKDSLSSLGQIDFTGVKFYDPLLLFSPHWPDNLFGKISKPPVYFLGVPLLIFLGIIFKKKERDYSILFAYVFFVLLSLIPIGTIYRDSTKFYIPVILLSGILIGKTVELFKKPLLTFIVFLYLIFLVYPAIFLKMNFVLSNRDHNPDYYKIYQNLESDDSFFRSIWVPERHPITFETENRPALDAKDMVRFTPFSFLNVGEDPFNFLNNSNFIEDFKVLGIKYLVLSDNPREIAKTLEEKENWDQITSLVSKTKGIEKLNWVASIPVYKIPNTYPHAFSISKLTGVVGSPVSAKYPSVNFEDGKFNPMDLQNVDPDTFGIYLNGKTQVDFTMSFLKKYFLFPKDAIVKEWAVYTNDQYLKYKYELLTRGVDFKDLDYGGGIGFSTRVNEKLTFKFNIPQNGSYVIASRAMKLGDKNGLHWQISAPRQISKGIYEYEIVNDSSLMVVNSVALIPLAEWQKANYMASSYIKRFGLIKEQELNKFTAYKEIKFEKLDTLQYKISINDKGWIVFTDNFSDLWKMKGADVHLPIYSMVNGYYLDGKAKNVVLEFIGQKYFRVGVYISIFGIATLLIIYIMYEKIYRRRLKN